jgi:hypothetical protein
MTAALIQRLQDASEGSRELDFAIFAALGTHVLEKRNRDQKAWWYPSTGDGLRISNEPWGYYYGSIPRFSTSIDAALTLVPEGLGLAIFRAKVGGASRVELENITGHEFFAEAATPALSLCIAALKALDRSE